MAQIQTDIRMTENERHEKIMKYVRNHPKGIKAKVLEYMTKNGSSPVTAFKDLTYLINKGRITVLKDKPNSQVHYLVINDKNEFNQIDKELSEIESVIDGMWEPIHNQRVRILENEEHMDISFQIPYKEAVETMLQVLLVRTNRKIQSKDDSQVLYSKITHLILKLALQFWNMNDSTTFHPLWFKTDLNTMRQGLLRPGFEKSSAISVELLSNLIEKIENFEKQFLNIS